MTESLTVYFEGEKQGAAVLIAVGLASLTASGVFFQARFGLRAFAVTLAVFALIELTIGIGLLVKTGPQVSALLQQLATDPAAFFAAEGARMERVQKSFWVITRVEVVVIALGAVVALALKQREAISGVALGVLLHASVLLAFDLIAERRGAIWLGALKPSPPLVTEAPTLSR